MSHTFSVAFVDARLKRSFQQLKEGTHEERELADQIQKAIDALAENPRSGIHIPQRLWPKEYVQRYAITNLWKYDLRNGWRLAYTLRGSQPEIVSVLLEWDDHTHYERTYGY